jgi:competence protein ComEA
MPLGEGQRLGALAFLAASLLVYGASHWIARSPNSEASLPWGVQLPGSIAVEVAGSGAADGIYFFPAETAVTGIREAAGIDLRDPDGGRAAWSSLGPAVSIGRQGDRWIINDLPAAKRLALGLPVNLNRISEEELAMVPGIGAKLAARIVERRREVGEFRDLSDLTAIPGIGEGRLNLLREYLTLSSDR